MSPSYAATVAVTLTPPASSVAINDDSSADTSFTLATPAGGTYDVTWWVENEAGVDQGPGATIADVGFVADTPVQFDVDLTGLTAGNWFFRASLTNESDSGTSDKAPGAFTVAGVAQHVTLTKASGTFYPYPDKYLDTVAVKTNVNAGYFSEMIVRNGSSVIVATPTPTTWNGRNLQGDIAPAGTYSLELVAQKGTDYESHYDAGTVTVSHKRLVTKTFKRTIAAARTLEKAYVAKCSTLVRGVRGWTGSLGLYTNTKCKGDFRRSLVETIHAIRVPAAVRYGDLRISTYGGNAKSKPGSYLFFDMLTNKGEWGSRDTRLGYNVGLHAGPLKRGANYVWGDRYVVWDVYTWGPAKYDVKSFTVTLKYSVLQ